MVPWKSFLVLCFICLLHGRKSQDNFPTPFPSPPANEVFAIYCQNDFECSSTCGSYHAASSRCSCHPACRLFGDCCYNYQEYASSCPLNNDGENMFFDTLRGYKSYFQCIFDVISKKRYWMVSSCPESWKGPNACNDAGDDYNYTVGRLNRGLSSIPVESLDGITFRNIHCALCHGKNPSELTPWSFEAEKCIDDDTLNANSTLTISEKVKYLADNCEKVLFLPPRHNSNHSLSVIPCHKVEYDVIHQCENATIAGSTIEKCSTISAPIDVNGKQFKNVFCVHCYHNNQGNSEVVIVNVCTRAGPPYIPGCWYDFETGIEICPTPPPPPPLVPISITFNFGGQNEGVSVSKAGTNIETISMLCHIGQVFDPLESKCVQLTCPDGYYLTESLCSQIPTNDLNTTSLCETFALDITFGPLKNVGLTCPIYEESFFNCLPQDISLVIGTSTLNKNVSCNALAENTHMNFQASTTSVDTITKLLSTFDVRTSTTIQPKICNSLGFVEIIAYCSSFHSNATLNCHSEWLNNSHWYIEDNSLGEIVIQNSGEIITVSEARIQHYFRYSNDKESFVTKNISILRCNATHEVKYSCPLITMNSSLFKPDWNDSETLVYSKNESIRFAPDMYKILQNGSIQVCYFLQNAEKVTYIIFPQYSRLETIFSTIGISLSIIGVSFTLLTYCAFPTMRSNLASMLIMTICACLLPAQILLIFAGVAASHPLLCAVLAGAGHFLWLSVFTTSSMLGLALKQTFTLHNQAVLVTKPSRKTLAYFLLICFGVPSVISGTLLLLYLLDGDTFGIVYGSRGGCWIGKSKINLFAFGVPVAVCLVINLVFFLHVTVSICIQTRNSGRLRKSKQHSYHREALIYIKIFVILGLTWVIGFAATITNAQLLWYLFTILTSLQGVFIFLAFTVKSQIWMMWGTRIGFIVPVSESTEQTRGSHSEHGKHSRNKDAVTSV